MEKKSMDLIEKLFEHDNLGYAYVYPSDGTCRKGFLFAMTPKNIAGFIGQHQNGADKILMTDFCERPVLSASGFLLDHSLNPDLRELVMSELLPLQEGEAEPEDFLIADMDTVNAYLAWEDEMATLAECGNEMSLIQ